MDESLQFSFTFFLKWVLFSVLIAIGIYFMYQSPLQNITQQAITYGATQGGFTSEDIQQIKDELQNSGYDPSKLTIKISPAKAVNITETSYCPRGTKIELLIYYNEPSMVNSVFKYITGTESNITNHSRKVAMSERY